MELSEEAKAEIKEAIRILKEDGVHIHKTYKAFMDSQVGEKIDKGAETGEKLSETGEKLSGEGEEKTEGQPPPEKPEEKQEKPKKAGLWWKDRAND